MSDTVKLNGIMEEGYGISPKLVMRDKNLTIESKAIYAYISSYAGNGASAFPKIETACKDLQISKKRFLRHRVHLIERGYLTIEKNRKKGQFDNNVYIINQTVGSFRRHGVLPTRRNDATNNNKVLNNNISSSSEENPFTFYENNIGMINPFVAQNINDWIELLSEELVIEAMKKSLLANKKNFNYAEGILKNWRSKNVKTISDVNALEKEFSNKPNNAKNKKNSVDWKSI